MSSATPSARLALPVDARLPQLAQALDGGHMAEVFAGQLGGGPGRPACDVERVKYRPGHNLSVAYRLHWSEGQPLREQRIAARFCARGDAARRHAKAAALPLQASPAGPALSHDASLEMVAHWWPNDRRLAAAAHLHDGDAMQRRWLPEVAAALGEPAARLTGHSLQIVQLMPERRLTARVELHLAGGAEARRVVYAKCDAAQRGPATQSVMAALAGSPAAREGRLLTPRPLGWQAGPQLHWQQALPGHGLLAQDAVVGEAAARGVGAMVAALHGTPVEAVAAPTHDALRASLHAVRALLEQVEPAWFWRYAPVLRALEDGLHDGAGHAAPVTLHGDLHPGNFLCDEGRLSMIDLDDVQIGPAWLDLGDWCADAVYRELLGGGTAARAQGPNAAFCDGYAEAGGRLPGAAVLAWATAWQLVCRRVQRCIVNLKPGRYVLVPALLAAAQGLLAGRRMGAVA